MSVMDDVENVDLETIPEEPLTAPRIIRTSSSTSSFVTITLPQPIPEFGLPLLPTSPTSSTSTSSSGEDVAGAHPLLLQQSTEQSALLIEAAENNNNKSYNSISQADAEEIVVNGNDTNGVENNLRNIPVYQRNAKRDSVHNPNSTALRIQPIRGTQPGSNSPRPNLSVRSTINNTNGGSTVIRPTVDTHPVRDCIRGVGASICNLIRTILANLAICFVACLTLFCHRLPRIYGSCNSSNEFQSSESNEQADEIGVTDRGHTQTLPPRSIFPTAESIYQLATLAPPSAVNQSSDPQEQQPPPQQKQVKRVPLQPQRLTILKTGLDNSKLSSSASSSSLSIATLNPSYNDEKPSPIKTAMENDSLSLKEALVALANVPVTTPTFEFERSVSSGSELSEITDRLTTSNTLQIPPTSVTSPPQFRSSAPLLSAIIHLAEPASSVGCAAFLNGRILPRVVACTPKKKQEKELDEEKKN